MTLALQVAFMTGQSDPSRCALSPEQDAFLDQLPVPAIGRVRRNFPYATETRPHYRVPVLRGSWNNARQYLASRRTAFVEQHRPAVMQMLAQADHTVLLAGSCGLELLANLGLPATTLQRTHVFAYGAVARRIPACDIVSVRGRRDLIARAWRLPVDHEIEGHHLNYLSNAAVLALCRAFVARVSIDAGADE